jgi:hypothetical protein
VSLLIIDDNFLSSEEIIAIDKDFHRIPAIFSPMTLHVEESRLNETDDLYSNRFMYCSYPDKENFTNELSLKILEKFCKKHNIEYDKVNRTRSNTTFLCNEKRPSIPHVDDHYYHLVLLYYVNDSDGDTLLYKNRYNRQENNEMIIDERISPKAGRAVLFTGDTYHSFFYPNKHDIRSVININISKNEGK